jgi:hypothetical protein
MSVEMGSYIETVFVKLLDEGTEVMRPAKATRILGDVFLLAMPQDFDPEVETWEFAPCNYVRCEMREVSNSKVLVAVESVPPPFSASAVR